MKGCEACAKVRDLTTGARARVQSRRRSARPSRFARLRSAEVDEQIQRNVVRAEAFIASSAFPRNGDFTGFLAYGQGVHRTLLTGTGILGGGGPLGRSYRIGVVDFHHSRRALEVANTSRFGAIDNSRLQGTGARVELPIRDLTRSEGRRDRRRRGHP